MTISKASTDDLPELVALINSAYRGEASRKGWTTEADLLEGDLRTDLESLSHLMQKPGVTFLKCTSDEGYITGCVCLEAGERGLYLGMLSVSPLLQAKGIGKKLMAAALVHARENQCGRIHMQVISVRHELIAWYTRQGYRPTGETLPMPVCPRFGRPTQQLYFMVLEKRV
jgi:ribosomal protein S18 acetylase RimI-like enzyme